MFVIMMMTRMTRMMVVIKIIFLGNMMTSRGITRMRWSVVLVCILLLAVVAEGSHIIITIIITIIIANIIAIAIIIMITFLKPYH